MRDWIENKEEKNAHLFIVEKTLGCLESAKFFHTYVKKYKIFLADSDYADITKVDR